MLHARDDLRFEDARAALARDARRARENGVDPLAGGGALRGDQDLRERDRRGQRAGREAAGVHDRDGLLGGGERVVGLAERELAIARSWRAAAARSTDRSRARGSSRGSTAARASASAKRPAPACATAAGTEQAMMWTALPARSAIARPSAALRERRLDLSDVRLEQREVRMSWPTPSRGRRARGPVRSRGRSRGAPRRAHPCSRRHCPRCPIGMRERADEGDARARRRVVARQRAARGRASPPPRATSRRSSSRRPRPCDAVSACPGSPAATACRLTARNPSSPSRSRPLCMRRPGVVEIQRELARRPPAPRRGSPPSPRATSRAARPG